MKDIYLQPTEDGPDLKLTNGLPTLTGGLDNMIYLLLTTGTWWGNTTVDTDEKLRSSIPQIMREGTLTNSTRLNIKAEAERVLAVMVSLGIVQTITVDAEIPSKGTLYLSVQADQVDSDETDNFIYALNWADQKITIQEGTW